MQQPWTVEFYNERTAEWIGIVTIWPDDQRDTLQRALEHARQRKAVEAAMSTSGITHCPSVFRTRGRTTGQTVVVS